jgi:hypothetical protein
MPRQIQFEDVINMLYQLTLEICKKYDANLEAIGINNPEEFAAYACAYAIGNIETVFPGAFPSKTEAASVGAASVSDERIPF